MKDEPRKSEKREYIQREKEVKTRKENDVWENLYYIKKEKRWGKKRDDNEKKNPKEANERERKRKRKRKR